MMRLKEKTKKRIRLTAVLCLLLLLTGAWVACGGGGSSTEGDSTNDPASVTDTAVAQWHHVLVQDLAAERDTGGGLLTPNIQVAKDNGGNIHLSYLNNGSDPDTPYAVYYQVWDAKLQTVNTTPLSKHVVAIDSCVTLAMALKGDDEPVIAYKGGQIRECGIEEQSDAMISVGDGDGWVEYTGAIGYVERNPVFTDGHAGRQVSVAVDSRGDIHLAYQFLYEGCDSMNFQYPDLCYVHMTAGKLNTLAAEEYIEGNDYTHNNSQNNAGNYCTLVLDADDDPVVFYYAELADNTTGLRVARKKNGTWQKAWIETDCRIGGISAAWDATGQTVGVAYYYLKDDAHGGEAVDCLKYAMATDAGWQTETVDESTHCGQYPSLAFDTHGYPGIAYYDIQTYNGYMRQNLKQARFDGSGWTKEDVASEGNIGKYNTIWFDAADQARICTYSESRQSIFIYYQQ